MSAEHLPDDLRRWPRDPYQVLGVAHGCDALTARKAYTGLIRHYKPEQFPEQFRLIREAYDSIKREAAFLGALGQETSAQANEPAPIPPPHAETVEELWALACDGQTADAYRRLYERYQAHPFGSELPARLYALLVAYPELDLRREACDWLARGILGEEPWGVCRQLYRREIDDHPDEVLSDRFARLLEEAAAPQALLELLSWRWEALLRLGQVHLLYDDMARLAARLASSDEESWVRAQLRAADYLAWHSSSRFEELCADIETHMHVHSALGEELSRLDFLREVSRSWHVLKGDNTMRLELLRLLPLLWTSPFENRHLILAACRPLADDPSTALAALDQLSQRAPLVAIQLGQALTSFWYTPAEPREDTDLRSAINAHLAGLTPPAADEDYGVYRPHLLRFCVTEVIAPEAVAQAVLAQEAMFAFQRILDDWPLRTVCMAHRLIWG